MGPPAAAAAPETKATAAAATAQQRGRAPAASQVFKAYSQLSINRVAMLTAKMTTGGASWSGGARLAWRKLLRRRQFREGEVVPEGWKGGRGKEMHVSEQRTATRLLYQLCLIISPRCLSLLGSSGAAAAAHGSRLPLPRPHRQPHPDHVGQRAPRRGPLDLSLPRPGG